MDGQGYPMSIGEKHTPLPLVGSSPHCQWWEKHPIAIGGKVMERAPHGHWWGGDPTAIGAKGTPLSLVERASHWHTVSTL